jgi:uncharacterized membrane protein YphA (DoxX/SURF4 family)
MLARQIAIGFGIAIIFPLLIHYGVATFHPAPKYEPWVALAPNATADERQTQQQQRQKNYAEAAKEFARILVIVSTPLGVAAILVGAYLSFLAVGTGLIFGGISAISWGYWSYWSYLDDWMRFASLLIGFVVLIFVGIRRATRTNPANTP